MKNSRTLIEARFHTARPQAPGTSLRQFIAEQEPMAAARAANRIKMVAELLTDQPLLGRPVSRPTGETRHDIRDFPLTFGSGGYVLRYQSIAKPGTYTTYLAYA